MSYFCSLSFNLTCQVRLVLYVYTVKISLSFSKNNECISHFALINVITHFACKIRTNC